MRNSMFAPSCSERELPTIYRAKLPRGAASRHARKADGFRPFLSRSISFLLLVISLIVLTVLMGTTSPPLASAAVKIIPKFHIPVVYEILIDRILP